MKHLPRSKRSLSAVVLSLVLGALAFAAIAVADNVQTNDLDTGGNATKAAGGTGSAEVRIVGNNSPSGDVSGCNVDANNPATVAFSSNQSWLTFTSPNVSVTACGNPGTKTLGYTVANSAPAGGVATVTTSTTGGLAGSKYNEDTFTVTVSGSTSTQDTTPPNITYTLNPASPDGDNGWYKGNVSLTWSVVEAESPGSLQKTGCVDQTITADQAATTYSCSASSTGGSAGPVNVTIKRDGTAPTIQRDTSQDSCSLPGDNGWCRGTQTAGFQASDSPSGLADSALSSFTRTSSTNGSSVNIASGTVADNAGNVADSINAGPFQIDSVNPSVSVTGVTSGATYTLGSVPTAGCSATDGTSGVQSTGTPSTSGGPVGSVTVNCSATDNAGNTGTASVTYSVIYAWSGFFRPVDNKDADGRYILNSVKAGSAVPVKFSLGGDQGLNIMATDEQGRSFPKSQDISCNSNADVDGIEQTVTAGGSSLSYDATTDQYNYVWKTEKGWAGTCRQLVVKLNDGTFHRANFKLTK